MGSKVCVSVREMKEKKLKSEEKTFIVVGIDVFTVDIDPPSIAAGTSTNVDVTVTGRGLVTTDRLIAIPPDDLEAGLVFRMTEVPADDTVRVRLYNPTAAAIDGASKTWTFIRLKQVISPSYPKP